MSLTDRQARPSEKPHRPNADDTEVASLAADFKAPTLRALVLSRTANASDDFGLHREAARASIDARRPAAAARHAQRAVELAKNDEDERAALALLREARVAVDAAPRALARGCEQVVAVLRDAINKIAAQGPEYGAFVTALLLADVGRAPRGFTGEYNCALGLINEALHQGGGAGLEILHLGGGNVRARRIEQRGDKSSAAALLAQVEAEGEPCEYCGAPRWTFVQDDDLGEFCAGCGWPHHPAALEVTKRRKTNAELRQRIAELEAVTVEQQAAISTRDKQIASERGKAEAATRHAAGMTKRMRAVRFAPQPGTPTLSAMLPKDATLDDLLAESRQALALARAANARIEQIAVELRQREVKP